jgi:hypothetical protein
MKQEIPGDAEVVSEHRGVGRRALLTRGGIVAAGLAGVAAVGAAAAGPASAATDDAVLQGTTNDVGTNVPATEITVDNDPTTPTPTLVLTNTGGDTGTGEASPSLRLTPATASLVIPSSATVGGDVVATNDGNLWFTHDFAGTIFPATVHTDATDNLFVPLAGPSRVLDTRSASTRANILDASGNIDSKGRLIGGKTIHINLTSLVNFGDAVTANLTVTQPTAAGFITLWSGAVARPTASAIDYSTSETVANLTVAGLAEFSATATDTIAVFASATTHVILDVAGFAVGNAGQVNPNLVAGSATASAKQSRQARARTHTPSWAKHSA